MSQHLMPSDGEQGSFFSKVTMNTWSYLATAIAILTLLGFGLFVDGVGLAVLLILCGAAMFWPLAPRYRDEDRDPNKLIVYSILLSIITSIAMVLVYGAVDRGTTKDLGESLINFLRFAVVIGFVIWVLRWFIGYNKGISGDGKSGRSGSQPKLTDDANKGPSMGTSQRQRSRRDRQ